VSRGQFDLGRKAIYMIIVVFILIFIFFYISVLMNNYYAKSVVDSDSISSGLIMNNLLSSGDCLAYQDKSLQRTYMGIVDMGKFRINLDACLPYNERPFRLTVMNQTLNFGVKEGANTYRVERPVLVKIDEDFVPGVIILEGGYVR